MINEFRMNFYASVFDRAVGCVSNLYVQNEDKVDETTVLHACALVVIALELHINHVKVFQEV